MPAVTPVMPVRNSQTNIRVNIDVKGRYLLGSWRGNPLKRGITMPCATRQIGTSMMTIVADFGGDSGDTIHIQLKPFGLIFGRIERSMGPVKYVRPDFGQQERAAFEAKIKWLHRQDGISGIEGRRFARYAPQEPFSKILTKEGTCHDCYVIDVSPVGALVTSEIVPPLGTVLALGKVVGRVVRHADLGFGIEFVSLQNPYTLDYDILPPAGLKP